MAFASQVYQGQRQLDECPRLDPAVLSRLGGKLAAGSEAPWSGEEALSKYQARFGKGVDLAGRAEKLGGWMRAGRLVFHCLGKVFELDREGELHSDCHQNPWLQVPMLSYVLDSAAKDASGDWVRFAELKGVSSWVRFFEHSCVQPLLEMARQDPVLLQDILQLFAAQTGLDGFEADASFLLLPLPKIPFLFTYQAPDHEFPEGFAVYLDRTAEDNLDPESLFRLGRGLAEMFRRIACRHGLPLGAG